jgi:hypothetical protein
MYFLPDVSLRNKVWTRRGWRRTLASVKVFPFSSVFGGRVRNNQMKVNMTHNNPSEVVVVLLQEPEELHEYVMSML